MVRHWSGLLRYDLVSNPITEYSTIFATLMRNRGRVVDMFVLSSSFPDTVFNLRWFSPKCIVVTKDVLSKSLFDVSVFFGSIEATNVREEEIEK